MSDNRRPPGPARAIEGGIAVTARLTPRSGRDGIVGPAVLADGRSVISARVRAAPGKGAANAALEALLARALDVSRRSASVVSGHGHRVKVVHIAGDGAELMGRAARVFGGGRE